MKIRVLSPHLANIIAAGEVVDRPASVVKELVENSIDAGARVIKITIADCGRKLICVDDDGAGMGKDDALAAFTRHATSKITTSKDLFSLNTLGFRGEALPSIASISRLEMETSDGKEGTHLVIQGSKIIAINQCLLRKGTKISVADLFYNTPARYKFLKSNYTENAHMIELVENFALANPEIIFDLTLDGKQILKTSGNNNCIEVIANIYGIEVANNMIAISGDNYDFKVKGFISNPAISKANRSSLHFYLNKRIVKMPFLVNKIIDAYDSNLAPLRYPVVVLFIDSDPTLIDVNVHPNKKEVKISKEKELFQLIFSLVSNAFNQTLTYNQVSKKTDLTPEFESAVETVNKYPKEEILAAILPTYEPIAMPSVFPDFPSRSNLEPVIKESSVLVEEANATLFELKTEHIIGQYLKTYIVIEKDNDLFLIDQHAAMERINFEKFLNLYAGEFFTIGSLMPQVYQIKKSLQPLIEKSLSLLAEVGFTFEPFGEGSYRLTTIPYFLSSYDEKQIVEQLFYQLEQDEKINTLPLLRNAVALVACKASIKAGDVLTLTEMEQIVRQLLKCQQPSTCPHGRPVMICFSENEILKAFKRSGF